MAAMNRRQFVGTLIGAAGTALAGNNMVLGTPAPLRSPTAKVPLGNTGITPSFLGLGTGMHGWMRASNQTRLGRDGFNALVRHAYDRGITFFDCADLYGTMPYLKDALKGIPREKIVIQSKLWWRPEGLPEQVKDAKTAVDRFRQELGTDYIDSILVHCTTDGAWLKDLQPIVDGLSDAKQRGAVRSHGVSCHSLAALQTSAASSWVDVQLARVNHNGASMDGKPEEIAGLLKSMRRTGKGVIGMKIFGEGTFHKIEDREASLRYVIGQQCVDAMVIGFERPSEIDETMQQMTRIMTTA